MDFYLPWMKPMTRHGFLIKDLMLSPSLMFESTFLEDSLVLVTGLFSAFHRGAT